MAVGRATDATVTDAEVAQLREDMAAYGAPEAAIAAAVDQLTALAAPRGAFRVHPDNVTAVRVFEAMATQWTMVALTTLERAEVRPIGLRYEAIDRVVRGLGLEERPGDFARIRLMEAEALAAWAEERRR